MTHNKTINLQLLIDNTKVIDRKPTKQELIINEALLIKENNPSINIQSSNFSNVLRIFWDYNITIDLKCKLYSMYYILNIM